jgi:hypothetical protein
MRIKFCLMIIAVCLIFSKLGFANEENLSQTKDTDTAVQNALDQLNSIEAKMKESKKGLDHLEEELNKVEASAGDLSKKPIIRQPNEVSAPPIYVVAEGNSNHVTSPGAPASPDKAIKDSQMGTLSPAAVRKTPLESAKAPQEQQVKVAAEFSHITYKEPDFDVTEKGPFLGLYGAYDFRPESLRYWPVNVFHLDGHFNFGLIKYTSPDGWIKNVKDYMVEPRLWLGRDIPLVSLSTITPYGGIGYRFLYDHLGEASDVGGYDRRSQYLYVPVGFELTTQMVEGWQLTFNPEYDILIHGWQTSYYSQADSDLPDLNNPQTKGYGLRGSIDMIKKMDRVNFMISPYVRYWHIKQSKTTTAINQSSGLGLVGFEPENKSAEYGVRLGVQF